MRRDPQSPPPQIGWKIFTHDRCSPIQRETPLWTGNDFPVKLKTVRLDTGPEECAPGWHYCADIPTAWRLAGMWPTSRPARIVQVAASSDAIRRGDKRRASGLTLLREATSDEIAQAMHEFSGVFGEHAQRMAIEQLAWLQALARPHASPARVEAALAKTLMARELPWKLKRFDTAQAAQAAWAAWAAQVGWAAKAAWAAWVAKAAGAAWAAQAAGTVRVAQDAWVAQVAQAAGAAWVAQDALGAQAAWDALVHCYAASCGWIETPADRYTIGIREAYEQGLELVIPTGTKELGWSMGRGA